MTDREELFRLRVERGVLVAMIRDLARDHHDRVHVAMLLTYLDILDQDPDASPDVAAGMLNWIQTREAT